MTSSGSTIVVDLGSWAVRVGYTHQQMAPKFTMPSVIGKVKQHHNLLHHHPLMQQQGGATSPLLRSGNPGSRSDAPRVLVGTDAKSGICDLTHPIQDGRFSNCDDVAPLLSETFNLLRMDASHCVGLVVTEPVDAQVHHRRLLYELLFEKLRCPSVLVVPQTVMGLFATGNMSGIAIDAGKCTTYVIAVVDGIALPQTLRKTQIAGHDVTEVVARLLKNGGYRAEFAEKVKEDLCFISETPFDATEPGREAARSGDDAAAMADNRTMRLPDGTSITIGGEDRCGVTDVLFGGSDQRVSGLGGGGRAAAPNGSGGGGVSGLSIPKAVAWSAMSLEESLRETLFSQLVGVGSTAMFPGFKERVLFHLKNDEDVGSQSKRFAWVSESAAASGRVGGATGRGVASAPSDRNWIGAAMIGSLSSAVPCFVSPQDYAEFGLDSVCARFRPALFS